MEGNTLNFILQLINESLSLWLALVLGILAFRRMSRFCRILFFQLAVWIVFYSILYMVTMYQKINGIKPNNLPVLNLSILVEATLLLAAGYTQLNNRLGKSLLITAFIIFLGVFAAQLRNNGVWVFTNYAYIIVCFIVVALYSFVLFKFWVSCPSEWFKAAEIWICLGILIFYTCIAPYMTLVNYLNSEYLEVSKFLSRLITDVLANVRYLFLALGFWLARHNALQLKTKSHVL